MKRSFFVCCDLKVSAKKTAVLILTKAFLERAPYCFTAVPPSKQLITISMSRIDRSACDSKMFLGCPLIKQIIFEAKLEGVG